MVDLATSARERGETLHLRSPHQAHDFVHASDVGRAIVAAVAHDLMGEVQIGSGRLHTVAELVTAPRRRLVGRPGPGDPPRRTPTRLLTSPA